MNRNIKDYLILKGDFDFTIPWITLAWDAATHLVFLFIPICFFKLTFFHFSGFAGRNKYGKKEELLARSLELVKIRSSPLQAKIRELYKASQDSQEITEMMGPNGQPNPYG